jgi:3-oxoadipate enol-lactonase
VRRIPAFFGSLSRKEEELPMPFIFARGIRIYYKVRGAGPRLLFISGTGADLRCSPNAFDIPLADHFQILSYDQRGLGQTDRPNVPYTMADYADDVNALLMAVHWDRSLVIGFSFGGMVAQEFALRYPQRVERLVLASTSSGGAGGASHPFWQLLDLTLEERAKWLVEHGDARRDAAWQAAHSEQFQKLIDQMLDGLRVGTDEPGHAVGLRRQIEARESHDTYNRLPNLKMPVFICGGHNDGIVSAPNLLAMQKQILGARLEIFEGGHLFLFQNPRALQRIIQFLLGELDD